MAYQDEEYLKLIKDRVDEIVLKTGYGEVIVRIEIKDGKPIYIVFIKSEERVKITT